MDRVIGGLEKKSKVGHPDCGRSCETISRLTSIGGGGGGLAISSVFEVLVVKARSNGLVAVHRSSVHE